MMKREVQRTMKGKKGK